MCGGPETTQKAKFILTCTCMFDALNKSNVVSAACPFKGLTNVLRLKD